MLSFEAENGTLLEPEVIAGLATDDKTTRDDGLYQMVWKANKNMTDAEYNYTVTFSDIVLAGNVKGSFCVGKNISRQFVPSAGPYFIYIHLSYRDWEIDRSVSHMSDYTEKVIVLIHFFIKLPPRVVILSTDFFVLFFGQNSHFNRLFVKQINILAENGRHVK